MSSVYSEELVMVQARYLVLFDMQSGKKIRAFKTQKAKYEILAM